MLHLKVVQISHVLLHLRQRSFVKVLRFTNKNLKIMNFSHWWDSHYIRQIVIYVVILANAEIVKNASSQCN